MTRYLKALGLATVAAFALGALSGAGSALAQEGMLTSDGTVTLTGVENAGGTNAITMFGSELQCPEAEYTGHSTLTQEETEEGIEHQVLHGGEKEITVTPHYNEGEGCNDGGGNNRTIDMNGCDYRAYDFTTTPEGAEDTYGFTTDLVCPPEQEITITGGLCVVHIPPQEGLTGLHATNEGNKVRVHGTVHNLTALLPCLGSHTNNVEWHTDVTVEGLDALGETTPISLSH